MSGAAVTWRRLAVLSDLLITFSRKSRLKVSVTYWAILTSSPGGYSGERACWASRKKDEAAN
jgi:hypothetical protein